jgi:hypothetical protein
MDVKDKIEAPVQMPGRGWKAPRESRPAEPMSPAAIKGIIALGVVLVVMIVIAMRSGRTSAATADQGESFKATLISGVGTQHRGGDAGAFEAAPIPCDVASRDLFLFGTTPKNVILLPGDATVRFSEGTEAGVDDLVKDGDNYSVALNLGQGRLWVNGTPHHHFRIVARKSLVKAEPDSVFEVTQVVDAQAYAVTTVKVYKGSVELAGQTSKSDKVTVHGGEQAKLNDVKLYSPEPFDGATNDDWEKWNIAYTDNPEAAVPSGAASTPTSTATGVSAGSAVVPASSGAPSTPASTAAHPAAAPSPPPSSLPPSKPPIPARPPHPAAGRPAVPPGPGGGNPVAAPTPPAPPPNTPFHSNQPPDLGKPVFATPTAQSTPASTNPGPGPGAPAPPGPGPQGPGPGPGAPGPGAPGPGSPGQPPGGPAPGDPGAGGPGGYGQYGNQGVGPTVIPGQAPPGY